MSLYRRGLGQPETVALARNFVGAESTSSGAPGLASIGVLTLGALGVWWLATRKSKSSGPDMSDVNAKLRARGRNPRTYGF